MKKFALIAIISLALLVLTTGTFSQQIFFNNVLPPQGSPFLHITGILQDKSGYMWFACINSLFRYDGYEMKLIKVNPADPNSIANDAASAIAVDSPGMLLIDSNITPLGYCSALINAGFIHSTTLNFLTI